MRTKKMVLFTAAVISITALMAFTMMPNTPDGDKPQKETVATAIADDHVQEVGNPCPCSQFKCKCGGTLEWTAMAYKEYTGKNARFVLAKVANIATKEKITIG